MSCPGDARQPLVDTYLGRDTKQPRICLPASRYFVGLPQSVRDWLGFETQGVESVVVSAAWLKELLVVTVLLSRRGSSAVLVLDPSEPEVASALAQWRVEGVMNTFAQGGGLNQAFSFPVHVDGVIGIGLMGIGLKQGADALAQALEDFTMVERMLDRLADTHRVLWAKSHVSAFHV